MPASFACASASRKGALSPRSCASASFSQAFCLGSSSANTALARSTSEDGTLHSSAFAMASRNSAGLRSAMAASRASCARARSRRDSTHSLAICSCASSTPKAAASAMALSSSSGAAAAPSAMTASSLESARSLARSSSLMPGSSGGSSTAMTSPSGSPSAPAPARPAVQKTDWRKVGRLLPGCAAIEARLIRASPRCPRDILCRRKMDWRKQLSRRPVKAKDRRRDGDPASKDSSASQAPAASNRFSSSARPRLAAYCWGVRPSKSFALTLAPASSNASSTPASPVAAASISAVQPFWSRASTMAPCLTSSFTSSLRSSPTCSGCLAAWCKGVFWVSSSALTSTSLNDKRYLVASRLPACAAYISGVLPRTSLQLMSTGGPGKPHSALPPSTSSRRATVLPARASSRNSLAMEMPPVEVLFAEKLAVFRLREKSVTLSSSSMPTCVTKVIQPSCAAACTLARRPAWSNSRICTTEYGLSSATTGVSQPSPSRIRRRDLT
mmetsp:Transcript_61177/g.169624  ORF Transcript_61177/g.169624 Transcript_61177/m.169624 type:complete len:500 (+) Transcript_61177:1625-3124(+)